MDLPPYAQALRKRHSLSQQREDQVPESESLLIQSLRDRIKSLENEVSTLKSQAAEIDCLRKELSDEKAFNKVLQERMENHERELDSEKEASKALTFQVSQMDQLLTAKKLVSETKDLISQRVTKEFSDVSSDYQTALENLASLSSKLRTAMTKISELQEELASRPPPFQEQIPTSRSVAAATNEDTCFQSQRTSPSEVSSPIRFSSTARSINFGEFSPIRNAPEKGKQYFAMTEPICSPGQLDGSFGCVDPNDSFHESMGFNAYSAVTTPIKKTGPRMVSDGTNYGGHISPVEKRLSELRLSIREKELG